MKVRVIAVVFGIIAMLGLGAAPASAGTEVCVHPVLYPYCG